MLLLAGVAACLWWFKADTALRGKPRREWKDAAIAELARRTADAAWIESELASFKPFYDDPGNLEAWVGDHLLLMKDGDWIAYASICWKEDKRIPDIFIGRSSDGKWYYSTYHFCIGMLVLRTFSTQSESLSDFVDTYSLVEFDGKSDECLNETVR